MKRLNNNKIRNRQILMKKELKQTKVVARVGGTRSHDRRKGKRMMMMIVGEKRDARWTREFLKCLILNKSLKKMSGVAQGPA